MSEELTQAAPVEETPAEVVAEPVVEPVVEAPAEAPAVEQKSSDAPATPE
jgi:hypothetical protein